MSLPLLAALAAECNPLASCMLLPITIDYHACSHNKMPELVAALDIHDFWHSTRERHQLHVLPEHAILRTCSQMSFQVQHYIMMPLELETSKVLLDWTRAVSDLSREPKRFRFSSLHFAHFVQQISRSPAASHLCSYGSLRTLFFFFGAIERASKALSAAATQSCRSL